MKIKVKALAIFLVLAMLLSVGAGCSSKDNESNGGGSGYNDSDSSDGIFGDDQDEDSSDASDSDGSESGTDSSGSSTDGGSASGGSGGSGGSGSGGSGGGSTGGSSSGGSSNTNSNASVTIWGSKTDITLVSAMNDFKKKYPNIKITLSNLPLNTSISSLKTAIMSGTGPDVIMQDHVYVTSLGTEGIFADLTPYGANDIKSKFTESCWNANCANGKVYGLPWSANVINFMYTKDIIGKAGGTVPSTYDELVSVGEKIKANGKTPYTFPVGGANANKNWSAFNYFIWLWREGGEILKTDSSGKQVAAFNGTEGVNALQKLVDLKKKGLITMDYNENGIGDSVGMLDMGTWKIDLVTGANASKIGLAMMPELKNGIPAYSGIGLFSYAVSAKAKNPQAAYNFIEILTTNKSYQLKYNGESFITPLIAAQSDKTYTSGSDAAAWKIFFAQLKVAKFRPGIPGWSDIEKSISDAVYAAINGDKNPKDALDAAAKVVNNKLARL